jgi:FkbM family methyltransferase
MNFDDALKRYLPRVWFRLKFIKYKYLGRGEPELRLLRHLVPAGTTAIDVGASIGIFSAELAQHAAKVLAFEANPEVAQFTRSVAARNVEVINVALSRHAGRAILQMPKNRKGHAVTELASIEGASMSAQAITIDVETRRLDDFRWAIAASSRSTWKGTRRPLSPAPRR